MRIPPQGEVNTEVFSDARESVVVGWAGGTMNQFRELDVVIVQTRSFIRDTKLFIGTQCASNSNPQFLLGGAIRCQAIPIFLRLEHQRCLATV